MIDPACQARYHGTASAYKHGGCRCPAAREAHRLYWKRRRESRPETRRVSVVGTARRVRALWAIGHNSATIGAVAGMSADQVHQTTRRPLWVSLATAEAVKRAYDALSMTPGTSEETRGRAQRAGYPPPLAWDDESIDDPTVSPRRGRLQAHRGIDWVAVERACGGERVRLSPADRVEVVRRLWELSDNEIRHRAGIHARTVQRIRRLIEAEEDVA